MAMAGRGAPSTSSSGPGLPVLARRVSAAASGDRAGQAAAARASGSESLPV